MASTLAPTKAPASPRQAPSEHIEAGVRRMFAASALSRIRFLRFDYTIKDRSVYIEVWTCPSEADLDKPAREQQRYFVTRDYYSNTFACTCAGFQTAGRCKHCELLKIFLGQRDVEYPRCSRCGFGMYDRDPERPNVWRCDRHGGQQ